MSTKRLHFKDHFNEANIWSPVITKRFVSCSIIAIFSSLLVSNVAACESLLGGDRHSGGGSRGRRGRGARTCRRGRRACSTAIPLPARGGGGCVREGRRQIGQRRHIIVAAWGRSTIVVLLRMLGGAAVGEAIYHWLRSAAGRLIRMVPLITITP